MKKFHTIVIFIITLMGFCLAQETDKLIKITPPKIRKHTVPMPQMNKVKKKVNLDLNEKIAIKLAEIILENKYGEKVLKQKPWIISENVSAQPAPSGFEVTCVLCSCATPNERRMAWDVKDEIIGRRNCQNIGTAV